MTRLLISLFISFLILSSQELKAQTDGDTKDQAKREAAQRNFDKYKQSADTFNQQLASIDSIYKAGALLLKNNQNTFKKAKRAFKYLEINYKAQLLPHQKKAKSKNRKDAAKARQEIQIIKARFRDNGNQTAKVANNASRNMIRAQKIMNRAKTRSELLIPRLKQILEQMDKWEQVLLKLDEE